MLNNRESRRHFVVRFEGYIETTVAIYQPRNKKWIQLPLWEFGKQLILQFTKVGFLVEIRES